MGGKGFTYIAAIAIVAALVVHPATRDLSSALTPQGPYAKYQLLTAKYFGELRFDEARESARAAYREALKSPTPERITRPLASLCAIETAAYRYREAAQVCLEARQEAERLSDRDMLALSAFHQSNLYFHLGAFDEAEAAMERVRAAAPIRTQILRQAALLQHESRLASRRESPVRAMPLFVAAADAAFGEGDISRAGQVWDSAAHEFFQDGDLDETERLATESFRLRRLFDPAQVSSSLLLFSELRLRQSRPVEALRFAALAFQNRADARQPSFSFYLDRGMALLALQRYREAVVDLEAAAGDVRALRLTMAPADSLRRGASGRQQDVFAALSDAYAHLFTQTGDRKFAEKGFNAAAESRAYAFRETSGELDRVRGRLTQEYFQVLDQHRKAEESLFAHDSPEERRRLAALQLKLTELELSAGLDVPFDAGNAHMAWQIRPNAGQALLHFSLGEDRSLLWTVTSRHIGLVVLPARSAIERLAFAFRDGVEGGAPSGAKARELHDLLFAGLPVQIRQHHDWRIVADGALNQIPFAALETAPGHYLLEDHAIRMVPHAFNADGESASWSGPATAFGDPVYNPADGRDPGRRWSLAPSVPWLPRLPGTTREIRACSRHWGDQPKIFLGPDVGLEQIKASLKGEPRLIHFAMHMVPGPTNPAETRLALAVANDGTPHFLDPATIASMKVHSRLVVLSGCRAGSGETVPGEGIAGLGRAWLLAGAGSVAATLWPIDDDSGELFQAFYAALGSRTPEAALRHAQLEMIRSGTWRAQPRYWGAYFMMGRA